MLTLEKKFLNNVESYFVYYYFIIISFCGLAVRYLGRDFLSNDMEKALLPWWEKISSLGNEALGTQVGDYNIPYQTLIYIMSKFSGEPIYWYKGLSIIFDYILAISCGLLVLEFIKYNRRIIFSIVYSLVLVFPTVFLNSGFWGQCDSIYCSFIIISILFLLKNKFNVAFILLGVAFSFKLQTILILPLFCFYYLRNKNFSLLKLIFIVVGTMYTLSLPGLIYGRGLLSIFQIYVNQSEYSYLWVNFPSFWSLITMSNIETHSLFKTIGVIITFTILFTGLLIIVYKNISIEKEMVIYIAIWTIYTCVLFLPNMHDRYSYLLDLFFVLLLFVNRKMGVFSIIPVLSSILLYSIYLFKYIVLPVEIIAVFYIINYILYSYYIFNFKFHVKAQLSL